jgi:predicted amidohydrolase
MIGGRFECSPTMKLKIATCQFPVDRDPRDNVRHVIRQMGEAARRGAQVAHFAEAALSGYAGVDLPSLENYPWPELDRALREVMARARSLRLWVVLGSMHRLSGRHKPHNCAYVINDRGEIEDRYDKLFCTGDAAGTKGDLKYFTPGDHFVTFTVRGVRCGVFICHDFRYPELYRESSRQKVQLIFHSYHQGRFSKQKARTKGRAHAIMVPATMQTYAAVNHQWISAANTTQAESAWPSFTVRPDGMIAGRLALHRPGVLLTDIDDGSAYEDSSRRWRTRALRGILHSGAVVQDPRSRDRHSV